jgi:membrane protein
LYLMLGWVSVWGPAHEQFHRLLEGFLAPLPEAHRKDLMDFILAFKDEYILQIQQRATTLGAGAFFVMFWISSKVFFNVENLMNRIWKTDSVRSWLERIRNFLLSGVLIPVAGAVAFAVPAVAERWFGLQVGAWLQDGLPTLVFFTGVLLTYRMFPNTNVRWKSAAVGAASASALFFASSLFLHFYFSWASHSAYGKAAALPLVAFFIFIFWEILILGAKISYLHQNLHQIREQPRPEQP